jgi:hypothetical protein
MLNLQNLSASLICGIHDGRKVYSGEGCWDMAIGGKYKQSLLMQEECFDDLQTLNRFMCTKNELNT